MRSLIKLSGMCCRDHRGRLVLFSQGVLNLLDNQVDRATGTVKLKAEFHNSDEALWPGQFVNAHLVLDVVHNGVTVPAAAVQIGPKGRFVYVVRSDNTVR